MGAGGSKAERIYKASKNNDPSLKDLLSSLSRDELAQRVHDSADPEGFTPLCVAAARGNARSVMLLLQAGANVQHYTNRPYCSTPLHEACAYNHAGLVTLLLEHGANPFVENGRGLTAVDIAINNGNVHLLRRLEQQCPFTGYLALKVPRYMGLGSEWKPRWCVIMPRMPNPVTGPAREQQLARSLLVVYKAADQQQPACKAWLDGAVARSVVGSRGSSQAQCQLALHRSHAPPQGAHVTGDPSVGFSMHLRPVDNRAENVARYRAFMDICNHVYNSPGAGPQHQRTSSAPAGPPGSAPGTPVGPHTPQAPRAPRGPLAAGAPSNLHPGPSGSHAAAARKGQELGPPLADTGLTDEELAQRMQQEFDTEVAAYLVDNPHDATMRRLAQQHRGGATRTGSHSGSQRPGPAQQQQQQQQQQQPGAYPSPQQQGAYPSLSGGSSRASPSASPQPSRQASGTGEAQPMYPAIPHFGVQPDWGPTPRGQQQQPPQPQPQPQQQQARRSDIQHSPSHSDPGGAWARAGDASPASPQQPASAPPMPPGGQGNPFHSSTSFAQWSTLPAAAAPPMSASIEGDASSLAVEPSAPSSTPLAASHAPPASPDPLAQSSRNPSSDEDGMCVVCLSNPCSAGFVHGDSVHKCCCKECAQDLQKSGAPYCPMCRQKIEHVLYHFY